MPKSVGLNFRQATSLIEIVCDVAGSRTLVDESRAGLKQAGVIRAVRTHDDGPIFDWLMEAVSYQGIADAVAAGYMETHGTASADHIAASLEWPPPCDKLHSYWKFQGCGYRKNERTCNRQPLLKRCPLPRLDLRNGSLNQAAYGLYLFMRDVCGGDFVSWVDQRLDQTGTAGRTSAAALIEPLSHVCGSIN
jgi:hypothetical protein